MGDDRYTRFPSPAFVRHPPHPVIYNSVWEW
jgi:hypothetical protein